MLMVYRHSESFAWALAILLNCHWCASFYLWLHVSDYALDTVSASCDPPAEIG